MLSEIVQRRFAVISFNGKNPCQISKCGKPMGLLSFKQASEQVNVRILNLLIVQILPKTGDRGRPIAALGIILHKGWYIKTYSFVLLSAGKGVSCGEGGGAVEMMLL